MYSVLQQREAFHLIFLRHFVRRVKPMTYAIKGGVNLRFFYKSPRYSEDMDVDIRDIDVYVLKDVVMGVLSSRSLRDALKVFNVHEIVPPNIQKAKQTESVQRFKTHLITASGEDVFTKIEFSRRAYGAQVTAQTVDEAVLYEYHQPPLVLTHYDAAAAIEQKVHALAGRAAPQSRDVFDLYVLLPRVTSDDARRVIQKIAAADFLRAEKALLDMTYEVYRDAVCTYLSDDDRSYYDTPQMWEEIKTKVYACIGARGASA